MTDRVRASVVTVSTRSAKGQRADGSGPRAQAALARAGYEAGYALVPDGAEPVRAALEAALDAGSRLIVTAGGTGVSPTDRTPEGTRGVLDRELPGVAELLRAEAMKKAPHGALTRGLAGVVDAREGRPAALIVNLPGSPRAVDESLAVLLPLVPHILDQLAGGDH